MRVTRNVINFQDNESYTSFVAFSREYDNKHKHVTCHPRIRVRSFTRKCTRQIDLLSEEETRCKFVRKKKKNEKNSVNRSLASTSSMFYIYHASLPYFIQSETRD